MVLKLVPRTVKFYCYWNIVLEFWYHNGEGREKGLIKKKINNYSLGVNDFVVFDVTYNVPYNSMNYRSGKIDRFQFFEMFFTFMFY